MYKEKILDHLESACNFLDCSTCDVLDFTDMTDEIDKAIRELNSKVKMPKIFDEWVKSFALDSRYSEHNKVILISALGSYIDNYESMYYFANIPEGDVMAKWLLEDLDNRTLTCIDAIMNGYEVER